MPGPTPEQIIRSVAGPLASVFARKFIPVSVDTCNSSTMRPKFPSFEVPI
jgi:hypothetical protein